MSLLESTRPTVTAETPAWLRLKAAVSAFRTLQRTDGALAEDADAALAAQLSTEIRDHLGTLAPAFPHDAAYLTALDADLAAWADARVRRARLPSLPRPRSTPSATASTASGTSCSSR